MLIIIIIIMIVIIIIIIIITIIITIIIIIIIIIMIIIMIIIVIVRSPPTAFRAVPGKLTCLAQGERAPDRPVPGKLATISLIWVFFLIIFALVGVYFFGGSLYRCRPVSATQLFKEVFDAILECLPAIPGHCGQVLDEIPVHHPSRKGVLGIITASLNPLSTARRPKSRLSCPSRGCYFFPVRDATATLPSAPPLFEFERDGVIIQFSGLHIRNMPRLQPPQAGRAD